MFINFVIILLFIAEFIMAIVTYEDPIHHISGKISKKYRTTYNYRKQSERKYTSVRGERDLKNKPYTDKERAHRQKFTAVAAATRSRMADPTKLNTDIAAFKAQTQYKTLRQYIWHLCSEEYDQANA